MNMLLLVAAGGAIGASARHLVNIGMGRLLGTSFPWGTLTVNIVGSLLMGILIEMLVMRYAGSPTMRAFLGTGFLGGFTTFSAFSLDVYVLAERGDTLTALAYVAGSVVISVAALFAGVALVRAVLT
ncbi:MAG: fluoride efflux transporter CrcB [Hyphomicrobiaceae bacterium]